MHRPPPTVGEIREALARVVASPAFGGSKRSGNMLRYVVEAALKDPSRVIKEHELGVEGLGRGEGYDPRFDPIARVEASRLRSRLDQYYLTEGAHDPIRIKLPKGGYSPAFSHHEPKAEAEQAATPGRPVALRNALIWFGAGAAAAAALTAVVIGTSLRQTVQQPAPMRTLETTLGTPGVLSDQVGNSLALSSDGKTLVMHVLLDDGSARLFARPLADLKATELPGTAGSFQPFMSPDGRWIGFLSGGKLKKTMIDGGGSPVTISEAVDIQGASWGDDGYIIAGVDRNNTIRRIPEDGGPATLVTVADDVWEWASWPDALPRGMGMIFTVLDRRRGEYRIEASRPDGSSRRTLARGTYAKYSPSGHVLYVDSGVLFAIKFDPDTLQTTGQPHAIVRDVAYREPFGYAYFDIADDGTLVYLRSEQSIIEWLDGGARTRPLLSEPNRYLFPRLSPDGRKLAYAISEGPIYSLYVLDLSSGARTRLVPGDTSEGSPVWTPDGRSLIFSGNAGPTLAWRDANGSGAAHDLLPGINVPGPIDPHSGRLPYHGLSMKTHFDIWTVPVESNAEGVTVGEPEVFVQTPAIETFPAISPDGKWMAYNSNVDGDFDIYVQPFPAGGAPVKVTQAGGRIPIWSKDGKGIVFATSDHRLMIVPYSVKDGEFVPGAPRLWADPQLSSVGVVSNYDLAPDGKSVVALVPAATDGRRERDHVTVVTNVFEALEQQ